MEASKIRLTVPEGVDPSRVLGAGDGVLRALESLVRAHVVARGDSIAVSGDPDEVELVARFSNTLFARRRPVVPCLPTMSLAAWPSCATVSTRLRRFAMTCCFRIAAASFAPRRSGKSAMWMPSARIPSRLAWVQPVPVRLIWPWRSPFAALKRHEVGRLILTRPVVEAGENLGFLPGTLEEKIDPYMRPLYDALFDMMDRERTDELMERGVIEIAPLAYMRGRTLSDAFVVLDEAQNTTPEQMKMFLTRLGFNSKFVITGDLSQRDLVGRRGGLADVEKILGRVDDVAFAHLERADVVRHALVGRIVEAYDAYDGVREQRSRDRKESR